MTNENTKNKKTSDTLSKSIISKIESGAVAMKPKWQFALHAIVLVLALVAVGALTLFLARATFFYIRISEISELTGFGPRGWGAFVRHFPWPFLLSDLALITAIVLGVRNFRAGARVPVGYLLIALLFIAGVLGFVLDRSHFAARYIPHRSPMSQGSDVCRCEVKSIDNDHITANDVETGREYTIIIPVDAPYATSEPLRPGDHIFVAGESEGSDTIRAFGLHKRRVPHELFETEQEEPMQ